MTGHDGCKDKFGELIFNSICIFFIVFLSFLGLAFIFELIVKIICFS